MLCYTSWVTPVSQIPDFEIYGDIENRATAHGCTGCALHNSRVGLLITLATIGNAPLVCNASLFHHLQQPSLRDLILSWWTCSTIQQILSEHLLCMSYCCRLWEYIKKDMISIYMELTLWQSGEGRQIMNKNQIKYILYHMGISARESSNATWRGNGIPAIRELLFETRLAERLHCWHFWSECSSNWDYFRQSKEQAQTS